MIISCFLAYIRVIAERLAPNWGFMRLGNLNLMVSLFSVIISLI